MILVIIVFFTLSINFIFKIPSPTGGYEAITYKVGLGISVIAGAITATLLFVFKFQRSICRHLLLQLVLHHQKSVSNMSVKAANINGKITYLEDF